jgi:hypothetical protein
VRFDDEVSEPEDPTRRFLDQTVPKHDEWDGREPEDGPARPRHVQYPVEPVEPWTAKERRANTIRNVAWGVGPSAAFIAGAALSDSATDDNDAELTRQEPDHIGPDSSGDGDFGGAGSGW